MSRKNNNAAILDVQGFSSKTGDLSTLQQDNVIVNVETRSLSDLTGFKVNSKFSQAIISEGEIVNCVSDGYHLLKNEDYFLKFEELLIEADIQYATRSINRQNRHFAVDYILNDPKYIIDVKCGGNDTILPMMRLSNSYAGYPTSGTFGFFRKVCDNGLHVAKTQVGFKMRHKSDVEEIVFPEMGSLIYKFVDNEFFSLHKKFEVLAETPIKDLSEFVKFTCTKLDLFKYEQSEKNPTTPSKNAEFVMDIITRESNILGTNPNLWLGYNAFNEYIHKSQKSFTEQRLTDAHVFDAVLEMAN